MIMKMQRAAQILHVTRVSKSTAKTVVKTHGTCSPIPERATKNRRDEIHSYFYRSRVSDSKHDDDLAHSVQNVQLYVIFYTNLFNKNKRIHSTSANNT